MNRALLAALFVAPTMLGAQLTTEIHSDRSVWTRGLVHYGKWGAALVAAGLTAMAAHEHSNSNQVFSQLVDMCHSNNASCALGPSGAYLNAGAEQLYQSSLYYDRRARLRLVLGQTSLLVSVGLFVMDLRHHVSKPDNIPFHPKLTIGARPGEARVGVRMRL